jgi:hypothetical protein
MNVSQILVLKKHGVLEGADLTEKFDVYFRRSACFCHHCKEFKFSLCTHVSDVGELLKVNLVKKTIPDPLVPLSVGANEAFDFFSGDVTNKIVLVAVKSGYSTGHEFDIALITACPRILQRKLSQMLVSDSGNGLKISFCKGDAVVKLRFLESINCDQSQYSLPSGKKVEVWIRLSSLLFPTILISSREPCQATKENYLRHSVLPNNVYAISEEVDAVLCAECYESNDEIANDDEDKSLSDTEQI